ncbi:MAG: efflux transporter outer membrane subunit [Micavibrio sp.]
MKTKRITSSILLAALMAGCSLVPDYHRPQTELPGAWSEQNLSAPTRIARDWWTNFESAELNALMQRALAANNDLNAAIQRVEQARALTRAAGAPLLPSLDASGSGGWVRTDPAQGRTSSDSTGRAGLSAGYELDLFGANRAGLQAAQANKGQAEFTRDATALVVMGDVARAYFNVLNLQERLTIADQNLESGRELLRIVEARFNAGATTALDVSRQKSDLASDEASRAAIEQQFAIAKNALAVLIGEPPQNLSIVAADLRSLPVPSIAPGQPSELLERRPDIRAAELGLVAANADIGAARAAFFPRLTIGLELGIAATPIGDPATTTLSLLSGLAAPIFKGGLLEGNLAYSKARREELVETYRKTILTSFQDVEDALAVTKGAQQRENSLNTAVLEARKAYDLSKRQYDAGATDFQILLDARRVLLRAEDSYIQTKNDRLAAAVDLYKALGGGWTSDAASP